MLCISELICKKVVIIHGIHNASCSVGSSCARSALNINESFWGGIIASMKDIVYTLDVMLMHATVIFFCKKRYTLVFSHFNGKL